MKVTRALIALALVVVLFAMSVLGVSAQTGTWVSGIMIRNQSDTQVANVTITFYWAEGVADHTGGTVAFTLQTTLQGKESKNFYVPDIAGFPDGFQGSAVVSSDQPVVANINTQIPTSGAGATTSNPNRVGTSSGVLTPYTTLYFTQVMKEYYGWNSYAAVQNTTADTAQVTIRYYNASDGAEQAAAAQTVSIHGYSTYIFRQSENASLPSSWTGSVVVSGTQALAGIVNFFNAGGTPELAAFCSYNAFGAGATKLYVPRLVRNYYGYQGGLTIQNVGTADATVTITYKFGANSYTQTVTGLKKYASKVLYMPNVTELGTATGTGSAVLTSNQPIVATANEDNRSGDPALPNHQGRGITYNAIPDGQQTTTILFPQVTSKFYGYCGGVQIQNVGTADAHVTATFSKPGTTDVVVGPVTVPQNSPKDWFAPTVLGDAGLNWNGSVVVTSDQPIVGIANNSVRWDVDTRYPVNYGDSYVTYNGVNK